MFLNCNYIWNTCSVPSHYYQIRAKRRKNKLRVEVGLKGRFMKILVRKWAGHMERMGDEKWQSADAENVEGKWKRGSLRLRREDWVRDLE